MENYLVKGSEIGSTDDRCYLPIFVSQPGKNPISVNTWFLGSMFMDRYFIVNDFEGVFKSSSPTANIMPRIGVYDKWHPDNRPHRPAGKDGENTANTGGAADGSKDRDDGPIPNPLPTGGSDGIGAFWTIFLILFFFGGAGVLIKFFGKQCLEKVESYRAGQGTFQTGTAAWDPNNALMDDVNGPPKVETT